MTELLTSAQMRALEQAAIASGDVTGLELMERAGRGVVEAIFEEWPELAITSYRAVVLCGPGNNGGDGFVVARLLKDWGWEVEVFLYGDAEKLPPDARVNYERWCERGVVCELLPSFVSSQHTRCHIIIDALFGTGLTRPLGALGHVLFDLSDCSVGALNREGLRQEDWDPYVVSVDLPSGLCGDSGEVIRGEGDTKTLSTPMACANLTVTFHSAKIGHHLGLGPYASGELRYVDIGIDDFRRAIRRPGPWAHLTDPIVVIGKSTFAHKYAHGHALILSGPAGFTGASRLAARGALRIGAGLVTIACEPDALAEHAAQLTSIMLTRVADAGVLQKRLEDARINALCLGPGMGVNTATKDMVLAALAARRNTVLDADALTVFADAAQDLFDALHENCVLTPHGGEFARLFPDIAEKLNATPTKGPAYSKVDATREAAARAGCVVLFKGPDTVIAAADGRSAINSAHYDRAAPWLATAGSGDVLAGFITGLLARGFKPMQAAEAGAWLHVECARKFGPGLIAEDLPEQLPQVFRDLGV